MAPWRIPVKISRFVVRALVPIGADFGHAVMPGLVPGIHAFSSRCSRKDVDGRDKHGHDENDRAMGI
jgi:hypothetical protein